MVVLYGSGRDLWGGGGLKGGRGLCYLGESGWIWRVVGCVESRCT